MLVGMWARIHAPPLPPCCRQVPAPAAPVKKAEPPKPAAKPAPPAAAKSTKRRGPLPLWLAELLVLGAYVGVGLAATKYSAQSGAALKVAGAKVAEAYAALEQLTKKKSA